MNSCSKPFHFNWQRLAMLCCVAACALPSLAAERWQIVVLPEPNYASSPELLPVHHTLSSRLVNALSSADFDVITKESLRLPNCIQDDCSALTDQKIQQIARDSGKEVNLALLYQIRANEQPGAAINKWQFYLSGRLLDLETGAHLDGFETDGRFTEARKNCTGDCFSSWLTKHAALLAQDLGAVMTEKLAAIPRRFRYNLHMTEFTPAEVVQIDTYLKELPGYVADSLQKDFNAKPQLLHQIMDRHIRYISLQSGSELQGEMQKFLSDKGIPVNVSYSQAARKFELVRSTMPYLWGYVAVILLIVLAFYSTYFLVQRQKHGRVLGKYASEGQAQQWLNYFKDAKSPLVPKNKQWYEEEKQWLGKISEAKSLSEQAWLLADQHDYDGAQQKIEQALKLNRDDEEALALKKNIVDYKRGFERFQLAQSEIETHPASALPILEEAKNLNPRLEPKITPLEEKCIRLMHESLGKNALSDARAALSHGNIYQAYSIIDSTLLKIAGLNSFLKEQSELTTLRTELENQLPALTGALQGGGAMSSFYFYTASEVQIGRTAGEADSTLVIGFKRISRTGKQTRLVRQDRAYFIEDLASTNGTHYNGQTVAPFSRVKCNDGQSMLLGSGAQNAASGPCQLDTIVPSNIPGCLILKLSSSVIRFIDDTNMGQMWPSMDEDMSKRWVLFDAVLPVGVDQDGRLNVATSDKCAALAELSYDGRYYIEPVVLHAEQSDILINGQTVHGKIPLSEGVQITIDGQSVQFGECVNP